MCVCGGRVEWGVYVCVSMCVGVGRVGEHVYVCVCVSVCVCGGGGGACVCATHHNLLLVQQLEQLQYLTLS